MPSSYVGGIPLVIAEVLKLNPKSVLDVGCGFGKYGVLLREYLDVIRDKHYNKSEWVRRIDAVEVNREYITPLHEYVYSNVYVDGALKFLSGIKHRYDVILLCDVVEHFIKAKGVELLNLAMDRCAKGVIGTTPNGYVKQDVWFNNISEVHRSGWRVEELHELGWETQLFLNKHEILFYRV